MRAHAASLCPRDVPTLKSPAAPPEPLGTHNAESYTPRLTGSAPTMNRMVTAERNHILLLVRLLVFHGAGRRRGGGVVAEWRLSELESHSDLLTETPEHSKSLS